QKNHGAFLHTVARTCTFVWAIAYLRRLAKCCKAQLTAKLTTAPMAASTAVFTTSCIPSWANTLRSVPPPVPKPNWPLVVFISRSFLAAQAALNRFEHAQCQGEVLRHDHHFGRQFHRRGDDQLARHGQRFLNPFVKCRLPRFGEVDGSCCFFHVFDFVFV